MALRDAVKSEDGAKIFAEGLFEYIYGNATSRPNWDTYQNLLDFADRIQQDNDDLKPRDYIDLQSFIWVLGSSEYD